MTRFLIRIVVALIATSTAAYADCPAGRDLPSGTLAEARLPARALLTINQEIDKAGLEVRALLVLRDCKVVYERYRHDLGRDNIQIAYSVTKSVTVTLAGALVQRGRLQSLDVPLSALIRNTGNISAMDWRKAEQITLREAFGMTSGLDARHNPLGGDTLYLTSTDRVSEALRNPLIHPPGTRYSYSDRDASLYGAAVEGAGKAGLLDIARETLFSPLDFGRHEWLYRDREGRYPGGWALRIRPMDMAKLGQIYLQKGAWNGRPIMPPGHVDAVWTAGPAPYYGLGWWVATVPAYAAAPMRYANGVKGQRIYVYPRHDTVVVVVSSVPGPEERAIDITVGQGIARALSGGYTPDAESERTLGELKKSGFRGTIRIDQEAQDLPGR